MAHTAAGLDRGSGIRQAVSTVVMRCVVDIRRFLGDPGHRVITILNPKRPWWCLAVCLLYVEGSDDLRLVCMDDSPGEMPSGGERGQPDHGTRAAAAPTTAIEKRAGEVRRG